MDPRYSTLPLQVPSAPDPRKAANSFLRSLLNKNLRVHTQDGRMFRGCFKCTDPDSNIVLHHTYEYREPSAREVAEAETSRQDAQEKVCLEMTSRYMGLVVVPGKYITRLEVEEFKSQLRSRYGQHVG